jgi:hypothetical protein
MLSDIPEINQKDFWNRQIYQHLMKHLQTVERRPLLSNG